MEQLRRVRATLTNLETRADENQPPRISGYFAVYNSIYEIAPDMSESIAKGAFSDSLGGDIRALINHDTTLVVGRTTAGTCRLRDDDHGVWADIDINPNDVDAMNAYARVTRGDVSQASIGFEILPGGEVAETRADGGVHWTITRAVLYEVSICTFPAYTETDVQARSRDAAEIKRRRLEAWKTRMKEVLTHGAESADAPEKA